MVAFHPAVLVTAIDPLGVWPITVFLLLALTIVVAIVRLPRSIGLPTKLLWGYTAVYALLVSQFPYPFYGNFTRAFQASAGATLAQLILYPLAAVLYPRWIRRAIPWMVAAECVLIWAKVPALMRASSFDTALLALCVPFVPNPYLKTLTILTVLTHHGSTAWSMLGVELLGWALVTGRGRIAFLGALLGAAFVAVKGGLTLGMNSRVVEWRRFMSVWRENLQTKLIGFGPGSFLWISLSVENMRPPLFLCMHSDWLQVLFETGVVGIGLTLTAVLDALGRARRDPVLFPALLGVCAFGATYHPLRFGPSAIIAALVFRLVLLPETQTPMCSEE